MKEPIPPKKPKKPSLKGTQVGLTNFNDLPQQKLSLDEFYNFCIEKAKSYKISNVKDIYIYQSINTDDYNERSYLILMAYKDVEKKIYDEKLKKYNKSFAIYKEKYKEYKKQCKEYEEYLKKIEYENAIKIVDKYKKENK